MKLSLNTNSKFLRAPSIRQFSNRMKHIDDCVNLTIGQPDFPMPDVVKEAYISAIRKIRQVIRTIKASLKHDKQLVTISRINMGSNIVKKKLLLLMELVKR